MGLDVKEFKEEQTPDPTKSFFKFETDNYTLDLLPELESKLRFSSGYENKEIVTIQGTDIPVINIDDLILIKESHSRQKDLTDIEYLKKKGRDDN